MTPSEYKTVAIWEFFDIDWVPYCSEVCHILERATRNNLTKLYLGDVDTNLSAYVINLARREQKNTITGFRRAIRRKLFPLSPGSPGYTIGLGIRWQWMSDQYGNWRSYSTNVQHKIEEAYRSNALELDLEVISKSLPYLLKFSSMSQVQKSTGTKRSLKRGTTRSYPYTKTEINSDSLRDSSISEVAETDSSKKVKRITRASKKTVKKVESFDETESSPSQSTTLGSKILSWIQKTKVSPRNSSSSCSSTENPTGTTSKSTQNKTKKKSKNQLTKSQGVIGIEPVTVKNCGHSKNSTTINDIFDKFTKEIEKPLKEDCIICCDELTASSAYSDDNTVIQFTKCEHNFHKACLKAMLENAVTTTYVQCPTCKLIYGKKIGNQPKGTMKYYGIAETLPSYSDCNTICIVYDFPSGIQGPDHPQPGQPYRISGFPRFCFLPDNEEGRKILKMLCVAWQRRLTFTIGVSITTGYSNVITWNEIHHKTEFGSNISGHGYPDPNYFGNVLLELASHGITEDDPDVEEYIL